MQSQGGRVGKGDPFPEGRQGTLDHLFASWLVGLLRLLLIQLLTTTTATNTTANNNDNDKNNKNNFYYPCEDSHHVVELLVELPC